MNKIVEWFYESNRWKHLIGGFLVGLIGLNWWTALYSGIVAAGCLELKDKLWGAKWDWIDFTVTVVGAVIATGIWALL